MKKQILFITIATFSVMLFSCSKDRSILPGDQAAPQQSNMPSVTPEQNMFINPLLVHLDACYPFNGNLNEATGKLGPGVSFGICT